MWTIKSVATKLNLDAKVPGERLMMHVEAVITNSERDVTIPFTIENKELMDRTLLSIVDRLNRAEADVAVTPNGEAYSVVVPAQPTPSAPTAEEIFNAQRADIKGKLIQLKEDVSVGLATEVEFQAALSKARTWLANNKPA